MSVMRGFQEGRVIAVSPPRVDGVAARMNAWLRAANAPARRFRMVWNLFGVGIVGLYAVLGSGYLVGGQKASASKTLQLLINIEGGSYGLGEKAYHVHGAILLSLALFLAHGLGSNYRKVTRLALQFVIFYSAVVITMIVGGWSLYDISFGAPWWYVYVLFNSTVLLILAPSVLSDPATIVGTEPETGGESA